MNKKILTVIPAYNEEENIAKIIQEVLATGLPATILVIDDGSRDRTSLAAAQAGAEVISTGTTGGQKDLTTAKPGCEKITWELSGAD